jgi:hypothetical protein
MSHAEKVLLESISNVSLYCAGVNSASIKYAFRVAQRHMVGDTILDLGSAESVMTLQAGRHRHRLGRFAAANDHGFLHSLLWPSRQASLRWPPLSRVVLLLACPFDRATVCLEWQLRSV